MNLAGSHHIWDSAAFWPALGIIVAVLAIIVGAWAAFRAASPRRRLYYWLASDTPLIRKRQDLSEKLKVTYDLQELKSPRVVNVQLVGRRGRDIDSEAFNGKPVCLDLGTPIVECVKVTTSPSDMSDPAWTTEGSKLLIGPDLFKSRQKTVFSLLIEGDPPNIVPPKQTLTDVQLERGDGESPVRGGWWSLAVIVPAVILAAVASYNSQSNHWLEWIAILLLGGLTAALYIVTAVVARRRNN